MALEEPRDLLDCFHIFNFALAKGREDLHEAFGDLGLVFEPRLDNLDEVLRLIDLQYSVPNSKTS